MLLLWEVCLLVVAVEVRLEHVLLVLLFQLRLLVQVRLHHCGDWLELGLMAFLEGWQNIDRW